MFNLNVLNLSLSDVKQDQLKLVQSTKENNAALMKQLLDYMSKLKPYQSGDQKKGESKNDSIEAVNAENANLKHKCKQLEEKCKQLQLKLDLSLRTQSELYKKYLKIEEQDKSVHFDFKSNENKAENQTSNTNNESLPVVSHKTEPKLDIHPPLRARLQKLNEKSVALKWSHNPKNLLISLTGYNIYINEELCAELNPNDQIASINGLQDEGEYRICVRACCGKLESENSNVVVTRVKRKLKKSNNNFQTNEEMLTNSQGKMPASLKNEDKSGKMNKSSGEFNNELEASARENDVSVEKKLEQIRNSLLLSNLNQSNSNVENISKLEIQENGSVIDNKSVARHTKKKGTKSDEEEEIFSGLVCMSYSSSNENIAALASPRDKDKKRNPTSNSSSVKTFKPKSPSKSADSRTTDKVTKATTHSFIDNYEKYKAQQKATESVAPESTKSLSTNLVNSATSISPGSNINNNNSNNADATGSLPFQLPNFLPLPPSSPNRRNPPRSPILKDLSQGAKKSGHARKSSNESPSLSMLDLVNPVKYSIAEPSLIKSGSTTFGSGDRNSFLRQSLTFYDSFDDDKSSDDN